MSFNLEIITPASAITKTADSLRALDSSGFFGILSRHQDFITVLSPCILIYMEGGSEGFVALDGGILRVESGRVTVASREAVEGTDNCIRRAGELGKGGIVVVKVSKKGHDMRFDVPVVGMRTVEALKDAKARVLAVEAGKTLMLEKEEFLTAADAGGICVMGL